MLLRISAQTLWDQYHRHRRNHSNHHPYFSRSARCGDRQENRTRRRDDRRALFSTVSPPGQPYRKALAGIERFSTVSSAQPIDIGEKHTVTSFLPDCALAVHSSMSACDSMQAAITSGGSRIFPRGVRQLPKLLLFFKFLPKTAWKWKNLDPQGGRASLAPPLRSANDYSHLHGKKQPHSIVTYEKIVKINRFISFIIILSIIIFNNKHNPLFDFYLNSLFTVNYN